MLLVGLLASPAPAVAQDAGQTLLAATPLILKDGRIANVSVHVLPFRRGDAQFAPGALAGLERVLTEVATDCFLTAQVIGHVSPDEVGANDTLGAHRLARSRADSVQTSLIDGGLPAKSIASVWDWQFMVRDARATLWVFRLTEGEDCEGAPLIPGTPGLVADAAPALPAASEPAPRQEAVRTAPEAPPETAQAERSPAPAVARADLVAPSERPTPARAPTTSAASAGSSVQATGGDAPGTAVARAAKPDRSTTGERVSANGPASQRSTTGERATTANAPSSAPAEGAAQSEDGSLAAVPAGPARVSPGAPIVTQPIPAVSRAAPTGEQTARPAPDSTEQSLAAIPVRDAPPEEDGNGQSVAITFATNSSYFPPGASKELEALARSLEAGKRYRVHLLGSIGSTDRVVGASSAEEAARYNRWLAQRRMARVQEWLEGHLRGSELEIRPEFLANDASRRVLVRLTPAG